MSRLRTLGIVGLLSLVPAFARAEPDRLLVEAEGFAQLGGWVVDTQFIEAMGSPYLLAHGLGNPVADAVTRVVFPSPGVYRVFVRTMDWTARWNAEGRPGRFQLRIGGTPLAETFGTRGAAWSWHDGGTVTIADSDVELTLHDLTGFDGRCDAIYFTKGTESPPDDPAVDAPWRLERLGLPPGYSEKGPYDLVVVGGGFAGMGAAISASRLGCRVALIQDRPVLGGNGSSEVRVWSQGLIRRGAYPRIGEIVEEFADRATKSPGTAEEFGDAHKEKQVRAEPNIDLFLNHHAYRVEMDGLRIRSVIACDTRTGARIRFRGRTFADCTGHATIGDLADADWEMTPNGRMGMSNMWVWEEGDEPVEFPETPWALKLEMDDFPYPRDHHGEWYWESGFDQDPLVGAEAIRDWNLRAVYGAFQAMKSGGGRDQHRMARLAWVAYVGGPRESRRLMGDVVLTQEDIVTKRSFPDGCVPSTWSIDLHYPKRQYAGKFPDNPFISIAEHDQRIDRLYGYPIPYRCFYSRNIENLFMAGRNISVTHEALGTTRVMKTCGMMGEVVGKAAAICAEHECAPRQVYSQYLGDLQTYLRLPGKARRAALRDAIVIPDDVPEASAEGPPTGLDPARLDGTIVDDAQAKRTGSWTPGTGLRGYVGYGYLYASPDRGAAIVFEVAALGDGVHELRLAYREHENRGVSVPVTIEAGGTRGEVRVNMRIPPPLANGFVSLGEWRLKTGDRCRVTVSTEGAGGIVHADAVQLLAK